MSGIKIVSFDKYHDFADAMAQACGTICKQAGEIANIANVLKSTEEPSAKIGAGKLSTISGDILYIGEQLGELAISLDDAVTRFERIQEAARKAALGLKN